MANSYNKICLQLVFAVKYRLALLNPDWRKNIFAFIADLINKNGCRSIIVNGVEDHVHCLLWLKPNIRISDLIKIVKAKSSKHINDCRLTEVRFEWQKGYGIFSYHQTMVKHIYKYIQNQEQHHQIKDLRQEIISMLNEFDVSYQDEYLFDDPM